MLWRIMNAKEYRSALAKLDLSQAAAGKIFGVGDRTSRRWALDEARVPGPVAMLLRLMLSKKLKVQLDIPMSPERSQAERRIWTFQAKENVQALG
jgi:hypothetical protein